MLGHLNIKEHHSVYEVRVLAPSCTRRDRSANETCRALALLVIHRQRKFAFKFAIHFIFGINCGTSYFKSFVFCNLSLCLKAQHTSYAKLELLVLVIPVLCLWFQVQKCDKRGIFLPLFQKKADICIYHSIHELGMLKRANTELLFVSKSEMYFLETEANVTIFTYNLSYCLGSVSEILVLKI